MGVKLKYKTNKHIYVDPDLAWEYIENGRNMDDLFPEKWKTKHKFSKGVLLEGEQHVFLEDKMSDYCLTSFGRVFSFAQNAPRQLTPNFYRYSIGLNAQNCRINITNRMTTVGWNKNVDDLKNIYIQHKWPYYEYYFDGDNKYKLVKHEEE